MWWINCFEIRLSINRSIYILLHNCLFCWIKSNKVETRAIYHLHTCTNQISNIQYEIINKRQILLERYISIVVIKIQNFLFLFFQWGMEIGEFYSLRWYAIGKIMKFYIGFIQYACYLNVSSIHDLIWANLQNKRKNLWTVLFSHFSIENLLLEISKSEYL